MTQDHETTARDNQRPWSTAELVRLRKHGHKGLKAMCELLGRTPASVRTAASRNRISLRTTRAGLVLGQPRGVKISELGDLVAELRARHLDGDNALEIIEQRIKNDQRHGVTICPACGLRPARSQTSGLCRTCHVERLVEAHEEHMGELEAQATLWRAQQAAHRAGKRASRNTPGDTPETTDMTRERAT